MIQFFEFTDVIHSNYGFGFFLFVMAQFIHAGFHWQYALLLPGVLNGITGIANFMFLPNTPAEVGLEPVEKPKAGAPASSGGSIGFMQALKIPNVMGYALAFGFFKFINYAMFFWLPFFLSLHFDSESA